MNAEGLLARYARIADAPDAIAKLRRLVLDLAVRGKLLTQDGGDASAARALRGAREWLTAEAETTKRLRWKPSRPVSTEEFGLEVPKGWVLARVNDTGFYINGLAFKPSDWKPSGLPIIRIQNLTDEAKEFNYTAGDYPDEVIVRTGDLLVSWSATLDAFQWMRPPGVLNQHIFRVIPAPQLTSKSFLLLLLRNAIREMAKGEHAHGLVMTHINRGPFTEHVVLIPPQSEQQRIVAKVDELMALCDQLEAARAQREATRDRLAAASLARLNTPDPDAFPANARFALDALPALTTRPDQIKQLRQTILNLAVRGKLVPQDSLDEPASNLLARTIDLPNGYTRRRKILKDTAIHVPEEIFCEIPKTWEYVDIQKLYDKNAIIDYADGNHGSLYPRSSEFGDDGVFFVTAKDLVGGVVAWHSCARLREGRANQLTKGWSEGGDVLLTHNATVGRVALVEPGVGRFLLGTSVTFYRLNAEVLKPNYFYYLLLSDLWQGQLKAVMAQTTRNQVSIQKQAFFRISVPPIAEQHRIATKVDALMALCDQLEASLNTGEITRSRLLDALLHEALAPASAVNIDHPRAAVSGYVVSRLASKRNFGRTAHMKHLYLAESRLGLKLGGRYMREAAGPLDNGIYVLEKQAEAADWYTTRVETLPSGKEKVSYTPGKALKALAEEGVAVLGPSREEMDRLLDLMGGLKTEQVEIIATLFAAWNDALLDGQAPDDDWIVKEVREHWHVSKQRFKPDDLRTWLVWMRQNDVVPVGHPPRTMQQTTMEL